MAREFKFRAWNKHINEFRYISKMSDLRFFTWQRLEGPDQSISEFGWEQYTGIRDKNGKDIYENDIVEFKYRWFDDGIEDEDEVKLTVRGVVVYSEEFMSFMLKGIRDKDWERLLEKDHADINTVKYLCPFSDLEFSSKDFYVIGNIHENKELLLEK